MWNGDATRAVGLTTRRVLAVAVAAPVCLGIDLDLLAVVVEVGAVGDLPVGDDLADLGQPLDLGDHQGHPDFGSEYPLGPEASDRIEAGLAGLLHADRFAGEVDDTDIAPVVGTGVESGLADVGFGGSGATVLLDERGLPGSGRAVQADRQVELVRAHRFQLYDLIRVRVVDVEVTRDQVGDRALPLERRVRPTLGYRGLDVFVEQAPHRRDGQRCTVHRIGHGQLGRLVATGSRTAPHARETERRLSRAGLVGVLGQPPGGEGAADPRLVGLHLGTTQAAA